MCRRSNIIMVDARFLVSVSCMVEDPERAQSMSAGMITTYA